MRKQTSKHSENTWGAETDGCRFSFVHPIALAKIRRLDLLKHFFGTVFIPQEVYDEVVTRGGQLYGAEEVSRASWIHVVSVGNRTAVDALSLNLDRGEAEAIGPTPGRSVRC